jgi:hypothetical protein
MPVKKSDYPLDWLAITIAVKDATGWCCEWCGAGHREVVHKSRTADTLLVLHVWEEALQEVVPTEQMPWARLKYHNLTRIILTTAHLDRNTKNNERSNLAALCQRCHLRYDIYQHIANRRYGRDHKRDHQMKLEL